MEDEEEAAADTEDEVEGEGQAKEEWTEEQSQIMHSDLIRMRTSAPISSFVFDAANSDQRSIGSIGRAASICTAFSV